MRFIIYNEEMMKKSLIPIFILASSFLFFTCASTNNISPSQDKSTQKEQEHDAQPKITHSQSSITLIFAGDVMAHSVNYKSGKFERIWRDISPLVKTGDLSFANIEAPVADTLPWSTYPQFNMHGEYVDEVIKAGFNVFSLANNHTNDQYLEGIRETKKYFDGKKDVWACGVKDKSKGPLSYKLIEKNGWRILFVAITELLNRPDFASYIDYYPSSKAKRDLLKQELTELKAKNECDLFVLSIHTDEAEYVTNITQNHRDFYHELIEECGIDIVWANHPHVIKQWETVYDNESSRNVRGFIMYANGNTISGQRTSPSFTTKETERDLTGDGLIFKIEFKKSSGKKPLLTSATPFFITTYISPSWQFVVKLLDDDFIHSVERADIFSWADYLKKRKASLEKLSDISTQK